MTVPPDVSATQQRAGESQLLPPSLGFGPNNPAALLLPHRPVIRRGWGSGQGKSKVQDEVSVSGSSCPEQREAGVQVPARFPPVRACALLPLAPGVYARRAE